MNAVNSFATKRNGGSAESLSGNLKIFPEAIRHGGLTGTELRNADVALLFTAMRCEREWREMWSPRCRHRSRDRARGLPFARDPGETGLSRRRGMS